jgi:selenide,water dikinase
VNLPRLDPALQQNLLLQTLAGVRSVLAPLGAELLGGHSLQAPQAPPADQPLARELLLALVVNGRTPAGVAPWGKGPLRRGQVLILSRSVGSGVLFAGAMAGAARQSWLAAALEQMQQSQAVLVPLLAAHGCQACTDITGFGLLGHLNEMLAASSGVAVQLDAPAVPALAGALSLLEQGYASSLAPANAAALVHWPELAGVRAQLLIDPQTCGPLLAAVPAERAAACLAAMVRVGFTQAALVGRVVDAATG